MLQAHGTLGGGSVSQKHSQCQQHLRKGSSSRRAVPCCRVNISSQSGLASPPASCKTPGQAQLISGVKSTGAATSSCARQEQQPHLPSPSHHRTTVIVFSQNESSSSGAGEGADGEEQKKSGATQEQGEQNKCVVTICKHYYPSTTFHNPIMHF